MCSLAGKLQVRNLQPDLMTINSNVCISCSVEIVAISTTSDVPKINKLDQIRRSKLKIVVLESAKGLNNFCKRQ